MAKTAASNDRALLDAIIAERHAALAPDLSESEFFELFVAEQLLWDRNLDWGQVREGLVGGGGDGGIDGFYLFCNGVLLDPTDSPLHGATHQFDLVILQCKSSPSFSEGAVEKLRNSLSLLLDFGEDLDALREAYSGELIAAAQAFREAYLARAATFPSLNVSVVYATRGSRVSSGVLRKGERLSRTLGNLFSSCDVQFSPKTASDLVALARRVRPAALTLRMREAISASEHGHVALVTLSDYYDFITDDVGELRTSIFESNVRDYEGNVGVNQSIRATLEERSDNEDFWWLNNGVTVVASRTIQAGKVLTVEHPQIVNGLQTTQEIFMHASSRSSFDRGIRDDRCVLVRVVVPPDDSVRDRIIRATNSQTTIPGIALWATDKIQRDLEDYFGLHGYYYERRRNHYRNEGRPIQRIITIPFLAEAALAAIHLEPHLGPPRQGGRFLRDEQLYHRIFNTDTPLAAYLHSARLALRVERGLHASPQFRRLSRRESLRHLLAVVSAIARALPAPTEPQDDTSYDRITDQYIDEWRRIVQGLDASPGKRGNLPDLERQVWGKLARLFDDQSAVLPNLE